jgi:hypothetical protein
VRGFWHTGTGIIFMILFFLIWVWTNNLYPEYHTFRSLSFFQNIYFNMRIDLKMKRVYTLLTHTELRITLYIAFKCHAYYICYNLLFVIIIFVSFNTLWSKISNSLDPGAHLRSLNAYHFNEKQNTRCK